MPGKPKPPDGADSEWKLSGRDALMIAKDGSLRLITAEEEQVIPPTPGESAPFRVLADAIGCWRRGERPMVGVADCLRVGRLTDAAYRIASGGGSSDWV
jgi:hypothetical protein